MVKFLRKYPKYEGIESIKVDLNLIEVGFFGVQFPQLVQRVNDHSSPPSLSPSKGGTFSFRGLISKRGCM